MTEPVLNAQGYIEEEGGWRLPWHPPIPKGYRREYTDHTGRWYEDVSLEDIAKRKKEFDEDPLCQLLQESINEEIAKEIVQSITTIRSNV